MKPVHQFQAPQRIDAIRMALLSACCLGAMPGVAAAQESGDPIVVTGTRAVTGTKTDAELTEIPQSVSIVTAEEFKDRAAVNFQDVFRYSAGVATELNGVDVRGDFFSARGFPTVQYLDGLNRMPSFVYGARLEIFTLERAEVLRGPSAVLYGAGGAGGLFNGISKRPRDTFGGELGLVFGTDERKEAQFDITGGLTDGVSARLVALARDGQLQHESQKDDRLLLMPAVTFRPGPDTEITLIGLYQKDDLGTQTYVPTSKTIDAPNRAAKIDDNFFLGEPGFNGAHTKYRSGAVLLTHNFSDSITFSSRNRLFGMDTDYQEVYFLTSFATPGNTTYNRAYYFAYDDYAGFNTDNNLSVKFSTGPLEHQLLFGVDYTRFRQTREEGWGAAPPLNVYAPVYGLPFTTAVANAYTLKSSQLGLYVQDQIRAWDRVSVVLGARRDKATSRQAGLTGLDETAWTFKAGIIADVAKGISPYFSYAQSFLPVFRLNIYNEPSVPRTGRQFEAGVKFEPIRGSLITVALFDIKENNYVTADPNNIQNFLQTGSVGAKGIEIEANLRLPGDTQIMAAYSYTRARTLEDGNPPPFSRNGQRLENLPEHQASIWGSKRFAITDEIAARVGMGVRYVGNKVDYFSNYVTPAQTLADAMAEFTYRNWSLGINAANIFNTTVYAQCGFTPGDPDGYCYPGKDRTILASLRYKF